MHRKGFVVLILKMMHKSTLYLKIKEKNQKAPMSTYALKLFSKCGYPTVLRHMVMRLLPAEPAELQSPSNGYRPSALLLNVLTYL